jgi:two-component system copper resistance phosphate regulon response regulator CusR
MRILLIENQSKVIRFIFDVLSDSYTVEVAKYGNEGENLVRSNEYDLVMVDNDVPDKNGIEICKTLRKDGYSHPILLFIDEFEIKIKVYALDNGVDAFLMKPFEKEELTARIRALLRRNITTHKTNTLSIDGLVFDLVHRIITREGKRIHVTRKEGAILEYLMRNVGHVVTREMILNHVWKSTDELSCNIIDVHIKYLRDSIDRDFKKKLIKTKYGKGYTIEI